MLLETVYSNFTALIPELWMKNWCLLGNWAQFIEKIELNSAKE